MSKKITLLLLLLSIGFTQLNAQTLETYEIDFSNFSTTTSEMMVASGLNNWTSATGDQWDSEYCYAQNVTSFAFLGQSIRFGFNSTTHGKATTPALNLLTDSAHEAVLQLELSNGTAKGGQIEVKINNTVLGTIDATLDGDGGSNGTTFTGKMYPFEFVIPESLATASSTITLTHSSPNSAFIFMKKFKVFQRVTSALSVDLKNLSELKIIKENESGAFRIHGLIDKATVEVYNIMGQLLLKQQTEKDENIYIAPNSDKLLIFRISNNSGVHVSKIIN